MSDEGRRVFPLETALGVVANKDGADVIDFMSYVTGQPVCECSRAALAPIVRGWLYSLNPELMKACYEDGLPFENWANEQKRKFGDSVSLPPLPANEAAGVATLIGVVKEAKQTAEDKTAESEDALAAKAALEAEIKALEPFKKKAEDMEAKVAQFEEKNKALTSEISELKEKLAAFDGKLAIDDKDLEKSIKDIVTRAVGSIAAAGGVAAAGEAAAESPAESAPADFDSGSSSNVPDDFGFGTSGANSDGFGF